MPAADVLPRLAVSINDTVPLDANFTRSDGSSNVATRARFVSYLDGITPRLLIRIYTPSCHSSCVEMMLFNGRLTHFLGLLRLKLNGYGHHVNFLNLLVEIPLPVPIRGGQPSSLDSGLTFLLKRMRGSKVLFRRLLCLAIDLNGLSEICEFFVLLADA